MLDAELLEEDQMYDTVLTGRDLSPEEADAVEQALITSPDDIELRTQMLGFYYLRARNNPDFTKARIRHILWFIASAPEATIAGRPHAGMHI